ncbi:MULTISPECIES: Sec-independent protein translocase subunit TatA [Isoptericola]|uniref:Sec-independent protein translocase protein TatA n=1 Tax=Isoptericola haloaureus TaxID=1542902 RepID=A0ABU7Z2H0_9MICO|nr:Sec-independent protein translocase subunit TatA [Isoptericola sp. AK164]
MGIFRNPAVIITLILLVVLLFGAKRLPDVARSVGSSLKIFKKEIKDLGEDDDDTTTSRPEGSGTHAASSQDGSTPTAASSQEGSSPTPPRASSDDSAQVPGRTDPHQS